MSAGKKAPPVPTSPLAALGSALGAYAGKVVVRRGAERLAMQITESPLLIEAVARQVFGAERPGAAWDKLEATERRSRIAAALRHVEAIRDLVPEP